jgi:hypothetical protein
MEHIDITGFMFLEHTGYQPDPDLAAFLADGPPPIYIGFVGVLHRTKEIIELIHSRAALALSW